ncbi:MAG TPA: hypothetical protein VF331_10735 [Polyangiales bacterium]
MHKRAGRNHMLLKLGSMTMFGANLLVQRAHWVDARNAMSGATLHMPGFQLAIVLSALGVLLTLSAGFLGWQLVQTHHVGLDLTMAQRLGEPDAAKKRA